MTSWAERVLEAIDGDPDLQGPAPTGWPGPSADPAADPGPGPWDAPSGAVADRVVVAALIGYPSDSDASQILASPAALTQLAGHWSWNPPGAELLGRAETNPALRRLLDAVREAPGGGARPERPTPALRRGARHGYRLAAGTVAAARTAPFTGGRLTVQPLAAGGLSVTVEYEAAGAPPRAQLATWVVDRARADRPDAESREQPSRYLVLLLPAATGGLVGRLEVPAGTSFDPAPPGPPVALTDVLTDPAGYPAVAGSVACAPSLWKEAWRRIGLQVGLDHPFCREVERGLGR